MRITQNLYMRFSLGISGEVVLEKDRTQPYQVPELSFLPLAGLAGQMDKPVFGL